tara:strand:+ start:55 stop:693 length:639 start_codon:yes stop_codon:yes gene_type:complete
MRKKNLIIISFFILINNLFFLNLSPQIKNIIVVKVGNALITSVDVQNEIITNLIINNQQINQENINNYKNYAVKKLIKKLIKKSEIEKYEVTGYNKKDLENYLNNVAKDLGTNLSGLKEKFNINNINYQIFIENYKIELLWNTMIFQLYKNQTNINIVDVDNEVEKIKQNKSDEELKKIKKDILNVKKDEKLQLFSRSHFSNIENSVVINFQ